MNPDSAFIASATLAIAVSFGIARYGFGLFLPDMSSSFGLSNAELGLISSGAYLGYFATSIVAMLWTVRTGARAMLSVGMALATVGMAMIALAETPGTLIAGCILAGASPGLVFSPISEAISVRYKASENGPVFSTVNAGEGLGAVVSAVIFVLFFGWQTAWAVFAGLGVLSFIATLLTTPGRKRVCGETSMPTRMVWIPDRSSKQLLIGSFVLGITTTVFWTFAGGLVAGQSIVGFWGTVELRVALWFVLGIAGMAGVVAAPLLRRYGLRRTYALSLTATAGALCLSGAATHSTGIVLVGGAAFGLAYIMATSQLGAWAMHVYQERPSSGFGLTFLVFAIGAVIGPAVAGFAAEKAGLGLTFVGAGCLTLLLLLFLPPRSSLQTQICGH